MHYIYNELDKHGIHFVETEKLENILKNINHNGEITEEVLNEIVNKYIEKNEM